MLRHNKRGNAVEFLSTIIIVLIGSMVIMAVISTFVTQIPSKYADFVCQRSVSLKAQSKVRVTNPYGIWSLSAEASVTPLACKTQEFTINAKGKSQEQVSREILNYAARAWGVWGE